MARCRSDVTPDKINTRSGGIEQEPSLLPSMYWHDYKVNEPKHDTNYETAESEGGTQAKIEHRWN